MFVLCWLLRFFLVVYFLLGVFNPFCRYNPNNQRVLQSKLIKRGEAIASVGGNYAVNTFFFCVVYFLTVCKMVMLSMVVRKTLITKCAPYLSTKKMFSIHEESIKMLEYIPLTNLLKIRIVNLTLHSTTKKYN